MEINVIELFEGSMSYYAWTVPEYFRLKLVINQMLKREHNVMVF